MSDLGYSYFPDFFSVVEMETLEATIRIETDEDSLGMVTFIPKPAAGAVQPDSITFNPMFDVEKFEFIAQHMRHYRDKADAEPQAEVLPEKKAVVIAGAAATPELNRFALR